MKTRKTPGRNGFKYKPRFGLIIPCRDEQDQQQKFAQLKAQGLKVRVVCV
ncbi:hypothetical protein CKAES1R_03774 [Pseudomonas aeruginosa]|nr:hypothetical protein CKAES1M_01976 [Pseudomonas aeruginosa]QBN06273.1 hypothetical protein CKAES1R_03774 [Pseudomonas aeruginosa]